MLRRLNSGHRWRRIAFAHTASSKPLVGRASSSTKRSTTAASGVKSPKNEKERQDDGCSTPPAFFASRADIKQFGKTNYDIMLGDCFWHVYRMIRKLTGYACTFTKT